MLDEDLQSVYLPRTDIYKGLKMPGMGGHQGQSVKGSGIARHAPEARLDKELNRKVKVDLPATM